MHRALRCTAQWIMPPDRRFGEEGSGPVAAGGPAGRRVHRPAAPGPAGRTVVRGARAEARGECGGSGRGTLPVPAGSLRSARRATGRPSRRAAASEEPR
ncbi:hypothetical protein GCM10010363_40550 [Streptomyces omiyaensis]|nr:hypothetical protein GCM10010363_40550 [Streptomyces omiyaensis]